MAATRPHSAYAGSPRYTWLRTGERVHKGQRWFIVPEERRLQTVYWTRDDQAWAVREGFFLERVQPLNQVRLVSLAVYRSKPLETEAELCSGLLQELFRDPGNQRLQRLFAFIEQQDRFGWSNTWEVSAIETVRGPRQMRWLSAWHHDKRMGAQAPRQQPARAYDHVRADANRASREALGLETRELRRIFTPGCPCVYCRALERKTLAEAA